MRPVSTRHLSTVLPASIRSSVPAAQSRSPQLAQPRASLPSSSSVASPNRRLHHQPQIASSETGGSSVLSLNQAANAVGESSPGRLSWGYSTSSPSRRIPVTEASRTEGCDRAGIVHLPLSAPTSSSPNPLPPLPIPARRILPLTPPSPSFQRATSLSPLNRSLNLPSSQPSSGHAGQADTPKIHLGVSSPQSSHSSDNFPDENRPLSSAGPISSSTGNGTFGHLDAPADFVSTGDVNEDAARLIEYEVCAPQVLVFEVTLQICCLCCAACRVTELLICFCCLGSMAAVSD